MFKNLSIKTIVAIGIGSAVYFVLGRFVTIPTGVPNTNVDTAIAFLAFIAVLFGPIAGGLVGLIGHALKDALMFGSVWWSWVLVSLLVGFLIGLAAHRIKLEDGQFGKKELISFNLIQVVVQIIGWGLVAPILDILIYAEPSNKVFTQGLVAALLNIISVGVFTSILLFSYSKTQSSSSSLIKED
ncbi:MAG TPA: ECF-type riboflavin transporter substrate-binding protein [Bacilli bacterium]|nr:ECF-type riboflavin transporter substrate-binding protein [Bacilli bacterium]